MENGKKIHLADNIILALIILYLLRQSIKQKNEIEILREEVKSRKLGYDQVRTKIIDLLNNHPDLELDIATELRNTIGLLQIEQETKAVLGIAKIIENLLKRLYRSDIDFKNHLTDIKVRRPSLHNYIDFAYKQNIIVAEDYHLLSVLKIIRNEEAHELNVKKDSLNVGACIGAGIKVAFSLISLLRLKPSLSLPKVM